MDNGLFYFRDKPAYRLGFGCMRLPRLDSGEIDLTAFGEMTDIFLSGGGCYFDTAYGYHKQQSEPALREVLIRRYPRDSFLLATKLPAWKYHVHTAREARAMFYTQLERLQCGWMDYYLFQNMGEERTKVFDRYGLWDFVAELKEQGLIRHFGVSIHDKARHVKYLLDRHPEIEFVQLQINYADWENPVVEAHRCCETAAAFGKPVVVMEPVKGGLLAEPPEKVRKIMDESSTRQSAVAWALRFAASRRNVCMVLSGMSDKRQLMENMDLFCDMQPLNEKEESTIKKIQKELSNMEQIPCTDCRYCCEECPGKIKIPKIMTALNYEKIYGNRRMAEHYYFSNVFLEGKASSCLHCGRCEKICPQQIPVRHMLGEAVRIFGE